MAYVDRLVVCIIRVYTDLIIGYVKEFHNPFLCIYLCLDSMDITTKWVPSYIWMYSPEPWIYGEHQRRCSTIYFYVFTSPWFYGEHQNICSTIYLDVLTSVVIIYRAPKKLFCHQFECIFHCRSSMKKIKKCVPQYIWRCTPLPWIYAEHQRKCSTIYLNVFSSAVILCRSSNKVFHHLFEYIILWCDYMKTIKKGAALFIWMHHPLLWLYADHSNKVLHYFKLVPEIIYNPFFKTVYTQEYGTENLNENYT